MSHRRGTKAGMVGFGPRQAREEEDLERDPESRAKYPHLREGVVPGGAARERRDIAR